MRLLRHHHPPSAPPPVDRRGGNSATRAPSPPDDFAAVYDTYFPAVYGYFLGQLGDPQAAEDATSQTFLKALNGFPSYRETGRFRSWLFAIAHNVLLDTHRAHHPDEPLDSASEVHDPSASPEDRALAALDADRLDRAIARLPPDDREVLELRRGGLTGREIAAALGIGHEAAKKRQLRAMDRIRAELMTQTHPQEARHGA